ncbi:MAG: hypothetical protein IJG13_16800 [Kiritimatiellae bacterium]|nr:hypothetical protein [Kiritimatiellia bacterium]MBQ3341159.1 hypothetical protein [Kiritimatiellia bacterium]
MKPKRFMAFAMGMLAVLCACADVLTLDSPVKIDGQLDEAAWRSARWEGGFLVPNARKVNGVRTPQCRTEFAILADADNVYVGIRAYHDGMDYMKGMPRNSKWGAEGVEVYLSPDGTAFNFYQFLVTYQGDTYAMYYSEYGAIRPDPYGPRWESRIADADYGYSVEMRFPLSAFYMTRNDRWSDTWKVNVGRSLRRCANVGAKSGGEYSCWCDVDYAFADSFCFRSISGFPMRKASGDLYISAAVAEPRGVKDGKPIGDIVMSIFASEGGAFTVFTPYSRPELIELKVGGNSVAIPASFPPNARYQTWFSVRRESDGSICEREYPLKVDYQPIRLKLTKPGFRDNFYPGQDSSAVEGRVEALSGAPVRLTLKGPGLKETTVKPSADGSFHFDTAGFADGDATLTAASGDETLTKRIRKLPPLPAGRHATWIENGNLMFDGKPVARRNIYAEGFMGGKAFDEKYKSDDLHLTKEITCIANLDIRDLDKNIVFTEAQQDCMPSRRVLDWLDKQIARSWTDRKDRCYYYIVDEPECHGISDVYMRHIYEYVAEKDPYHVISCCSRAGETYIDIADWFETHPYINPHMDANGKRIYTRDFNTIGSSVDAFKPQDHPDKCIGGTPTCFAYAGCDYPTFEEYLLNCWCEFVRGAKTMYPYAYHDLGDRPTLYEGTRYLFESMQALEDVLLFGRRETLARTDDYECALWTMPAGDRVFALLNFTQKSLTVNLPKLCGNYREFRGSRTFENPKSIALAPLESLVACEKARDAGLKPLVQVAKEIADAEYARTHRGNQLAGRHGDFDVTTSTKRRGAWVDDAVKAFDGTTNVLAWYDAADYREKFYQLGFSKFTPKFREIRVFGRPVAGLKVKMLVDGEWQSPPPAGVEVAGDCATVRFAKTFAPEKLRLEFPKGRVELYEIELPELK